MYKSRSEQIFDHAQRFATSLRTSLGHSWAIVPDGAGRYRGYPVSSRGFQQWLAHSFHNEHSIYPGTEALRSAVNMFSAHASHSEFPISDVFTRLGWRGDRRLPQSILLHLANANNELIEITPSGHRVVGSESWHFLAGPATLPLPRPVDNTLTLRDHLRTLFNLEGSALERVIVWLFSALRPSAPYPVLVISGPAGSGKSMLARMLRYLIDPTAIPLLIPPSNDHDLFTMALHNYILAFDDASTQSRAIMDSLGRIASGAGLGICSRNIFDAPEPFPLGRPIIMTVPSNHRATINNAIRVELAAIEPENVRTETNLAQRHLAAAPAILGTLCAAVTEALSNTTATAALPVSRFADVHQWTMAAAPILGLSAGQVNRALAANPIVDALNTLLEKHKAWTGTATKLLETLKIMGFAAIARNGQHLSQQLNTSHLNLFGINLEHSHTGRRRLIHLTQASTPIVRKTHTRGTNIL